MASLATVTLISVLDHFAMEEAVCRQMKLHTLEKVYTALKKERPVIEVPRRVADQARKGIEQMLKLTARNRET